MRAHWCLTFAVLLAGLFARAQDSIPLWKNGPPGFEQFHSIPEEAKDWWVKHIHNPSLKVFRAPAAIATGTAVVVCPGGGFRTLVYNSEGRDAAEYLNKLGITVFVLKYRLFRDDSMYTDEQPKQDVFRAIRLVRNMAPQYGVDTNRIGIMGFSAGGEVAGWLAYHWNEDHGIAKDAIDKLSAKPAFQVLIYPGPLAVPADIDKTAPPSFLLAANDDECCSEPVVRLLQLHRKAGVPVEVHLYEHAGHGFNMGKRTSVPGVHDWPQRLTDWLKDRKLVP